MDIISKLKQLQDRLTQLEGTDNCCRLEYGVTAKDSELRAQENRLGITLPPSFCENLKTIGKSLYFYYSLHDFIMPEEIGNISSGELSWDLDALEFINEIIMCHISDDEDEEEKVYIQRISALLQFAQSGNGDIYAFDMAAEGQEKPVIYWEHETGEIKMLADSFQSYVERVMELYAVGDDISELECFMNAAGINPYSEYAEKWKCWFDTFLDTRLETERQELDKLFAFTLLRRNFNIETKTAYIPYDKEEIFSLVQNELICTPNNKTKELLIQIICEMLQTEAKQWAEDLWECIIDYPQLSSFNLKMGAYSFSSLLLAKLSFHCLPEAQAFDFVKHYLQCRAGERLNGNTAFEHLKYFKRERVIPWMEQQNLTSPHGWERLFLAVRPDWEDLLRWSADKNRRKVLIDGLAVFAEGKMEFGPPVGLPEKGVVLDWLKQLEETELLNMRKRKIADIAENVDLLYP